MRVMRHSVFGRFTRAEGVLASERKEPADIPWLAAVAAPARRRWSIEECPGQKAAQHTFKVVVDDQARPSGWSAGHQYMTISRQWTLEKVGRFCYMSRVPQSALKGNPCGKGPVKAVYAGKIGAGT